MTLKHKLITGDIKMRDEDSFLRGERAIYSEDNAIYEVQVLTNNSGRREIVYELKVVKVIRPHGLVEDYKVGEVFQCAKLYNVSCAGFWNMTELQSNSEMTSKRKV